MWNLVVSDFGGDETANFGPRKESGTALYQIDTLATISHQDKISQPAPYVVSAVLGDLACMAIEVHLSVFRDQQLIQTLEFENVIDEVEWSPDGRTIAVGDKEGALYIMETESMEIVFNFCVVSEENRRGNKAFLRICFQSKEKDVYDLLILSASGQMVIMQGLAPDLFTGNNASDVGSLIQEKLAVTDTGCVHTTGTCDIICLPDYIMSVGCGDSILALWEVTNGQICLEDEVGDLLMNDAGITQGKASSDGKYLFALDTNNILTLWDPMALILLKAWTEYPVAEFQLLETREIRNNSLQDMKLVMMNTQAESQCTFQIQSLPAFETVYSLQLGAPSIIAKCLTIQETLYLAEAVPDNLNSDQVSMIRFRCLMETNPETRLYRILHKNRFEEAEEFAKQYQLDTELVQKVKANYLLDQLSPWNVQKHSGQRVLEMMLQLKTSLELIRDDLHIAENCMRAALPSLSATQELLNYCKLRLKKFSSQSGVKEPALIEKQQVLTTKLLDVQHRLTTFTLAFGAEKYSGSLWDQFQKIDLLRESLTCLSQSQVNVGFTIWARHQAEFDKNLTANMIKQLISFIPDHVTPAEILGTLQNCLIPCVARVVPHALVLIVKWVLEKAVKMELLEPSQWPVNAILFLDAVYKSLCLASEISKDTPCTAKQNTVKTEMKQAEVLAPVQKLRTNLHHLHDLLTKYKCHLTFYQFSQETTETVTFRMLDKVVAVELIPQTLKRQIRPYMKEHGLKEDIIFSKYVKDLLERTGRVTSYLSEAPWETKVLAVIKCIKDLERKCDAILEVMNWAPVPWSVEINRLVQNGLKLDHPKASAIKEQCHVLEVKKLMLKYGLKNMTVPSKKNAHKLMNYMLTKDLPTCMEDALRVMESYTLKLQKELYVFRARFLLHRHKIDEALELLKSLDKESGSVCCQRVINYTLIMLEEVQEMDSEESHRTKQTFSEAAVSLTRYLQSVMEDPLEVKEMKDLQLLLQNIWALQVEYNKYMTLSQYRDGRFREKVLVSYMKECFTTRTSQRKANYTRLADLLQFSRIKLQGQLAIEAAGMGDIQAALKICRQLFESDPTEETANTLYQVALAFLHLQADTELEIDPSQLRELPDIIYQLASQALTVCKADLIEKCMELCKSSSLTLAVSRQCENGDYSLRVQGLIGDGGDLAGHSSGYLDWTPDDMFQEDTLVMTSTMIMPLVSHYAVSHPSLAVTSGRSARYTSISTKAEEDVPQFGDQPEDEDADDKKSPVLSLSQSVIPVIEHLKDNSHQELAFRFAQHMLSTVNAITSRHDMGLGFQVHDEVTKNKIQEELLYLQQLEGTSRRLMKDLVASILTKIFNCSKIDQRLAMTYCMCRPKKEAFETVMKLIKTSGNNFKRLKGVANVGVGISQLYKDPKALDVCQTLELNSTWGHRLGKLKINFQDAIQGPMSEKVKLLPQLVQCDQANLTLVKDFCKAFNLIEDDGLMLYLDHVFAMSDHVNSVTGSSTKKNQLMKCRAAIRQIGDSDALLDKLKALSKQTDSYDYEKLEFLLVETERLDATVETEKGLKLLNYLKDYTRISEPSEYELKYSPVGQKEEDISVEHLPESSKTRLPFHPLMEGNPWKIISPELNKKTVEEAWLQIAKLLKLQADQIYLTAVQNMVKQHSAGVRRPRVRDGNGVPVASQWNWDLQDANRQLLTDVQELLSHVENSNNAFAYANWMVKELPLGAEKVLALQGCINYAKLWHQTLPEESPDRARAKSAFEKFTLLYRRLATEQVLCQHNLAEPELMQLVNKPEVLINQLYQHNSVVENYNTTSDSKPEIHTVAEKVADINCLDLLKLRKSLIEDWLPTSSAKQSQTDADSTMTFNFENLKFDDSPLDSGSEDDDEKNLKRVMYLLQKGPLDENVTLLFNFAFKPHDSQTLITNSCRVRALRCLLELADEDTIHRLSQKTTAEIRHLMQVLCYLVDLEELHIQHSVQTFEECNKEGLIKGIWRNHSHQKNALLVVASLCLDYNVHDRQLWNSVLQQMYSFGMLKHLEFVLVRLTGIPDVRQVQVFPKMWQAVLSTPLTEVVAPLTDEQLEMCLRVFNLITICPILQDVDLISLSNQYIKLELPVCGIGCLLMATKLSDGILKKAVSGDKKILLDSIDMLLTHGLEAGLAQKVKNALFADVIANEEYEDIFGTSYLSGLAQYALKYDQADEILVFAVKNKRIKEADVLLQLVCAHDEETLRSLDSYAKDGPHTKLKVYLQMIGMNELAETL